MRCGNIVFFVFLTLDSNDFFGSMDLLWRSNWKFTFELVIQNKDLWRCNRYCYLMLFFLFSFLVYSNISFSAASHSIIRLAPLVCPFRGNCIAFLTSFPAWRDSVKVCSLLSTPQRYSAELSLSIPSAFNADIDSSFVPTSSRSILHFVHILANAIRMALFSVLFVWIISKHFLCLLSGMLCRYTLSVSPGLYPESFVCWVGYYPTLLRPFCWIVSSAIISSPARSNRSEIHHPSLIRYCSFNHLEYPSTRLQNWACTPTLYIIKRNIA